MNNSIPGWNFESDRCITNQKKPIGQDQGIVELLWQNGQVVTHNQSHRKPFGDSSNLRQVQKTDGPILRTSGPFENSSNLSQEDVTVSWIQCQLEDPLEQEFCSNLLLPELAPPCEVESYKPIRQLEEGNSAKPVASHATSSSQPPNMMKPSSCVQEFPRNNPMPAPRFHVPGSSQKINDFGGSQKVLNFPHFSAPHNVSPPYASEQLREKVTPNLSQNEAKECSVVTVGLSHCGSNHIPQDPDLSKVSSNGVWRTIPRSDKGKSEMVEVEPTLISSSGGSGSSSIERTCSLSTRSHGQKRKKTDAEASEEQSEATELKSADGKKASQQAGSSKRNRAAEVHNLSERRRRDRINEKMRALQQLIPNSNKTDKASMLEESLPLQQAHFRGRLLQGTTLPLPHGYSGFVLGKKSSPEENSHSWETNATFHDITYWNHDYVPSHNDDFFRAFHWLTVANALHSPVTPEELASSSTTL